MNDRVLSPAETKMLLRKIETVELTGSQLIVLTNMLSFGIGHMACLLEDEHYATTYIQECGSMLNYLNSFIEKILGEANAEKR